jgi:hypothetical protein
MKLNLFFDDFHVCGGLWHSLVHYTGPVPAMEASKGLKSIRAEAIPLWIQKVTSGGE